MAKTRGPEAVPDDIELLNIHRYPESVPASLVAFVRNSKVCQKRLEELLKGLPARKSGKNNARDFSPSTALSTPDGQPAPPAQGPASLSADSVKKYLGKLFT